MKIRYGFVSNSSSTSFTIFGVSFSAEDGAYWGIESLLDEPMYINNHPHCDRVYIGRKYTSMLPDQTRKQFEEETSSAIARLIDKIKEHNLQENKDSITNHIIEIPDDILNNVHVIEESWYDG